jgi:uracil-DNA glycosylase family 4
MCPLGRDKCTEHDTVFDPHVFSTMNPSKWMVVGQGPGYDECLIHQPFVGNSGKNFNNEIVKYGVNRNIFYITNTIKCKTPENRAPTYQEIQKCINILKLEIAILKPRLVITLGAVAFNILCPNVIFKTALGTITKTKDDIPVYAIYHPSPRNLDIPDRNKLFKKQVKLLCKVIIEMNRDFEAKI